MAHGFVKTGEKNGADYSGIYQRAGGSFQAAFLCGGDRLKILQASVGRAFMPDVFRCGVCKYVRICRA